jgi:hypothetical protein
LAGAAQDWIGTTRELPLNRLRKNEQNPNEQDDRMFNATVASIAEDGWIQPMASVVPVGEFDEADPFGWAQFDIVAGHHRFDAAEVLAFESGPCWLLDPASFDADRQKWAMVKANIVAGRLNPEKFTALYNEMAARYDGEVLQRLMGFTSQDAFEKLWQGVKSTLPPELAAELEKVRDEVRTVDDLSVVLNRLFREYGETLPSNVMAFSWGGKEVMWVLADARLWKTVSVIKARVLAEGGDMAATLTELLAERVAV